MSDGIDSEAMHILVADDHPTNQMVVQHHLQRQGHRVMVANDGLEAVSLCEIQRFDVVFMDVQMPGMDGVEACRRIRAGNSPNKNTPILAVTAGAESSMHRSCIAAGMNDVITKPLLFEQLSGILESVRNGRKGAVSGPDIDAGSPERLSEMPLDFATFLERLDGDEAFAQRLIDGFLQQNDRLLSQMAENLENGELESLRTSAHTIKGGALNLAAGDLQRAADALENAMIEDPERLDFLLSEVVREQDRLRRYVVRLPQNP